MNALLDTHLLLSFCMTAAVIVVMPGPSVMFIVSRALAVGRDLGARSIALPAISTGIYGFPPDAAAAIAVATARANATGWDHIVLCAFDTDTLARYQALLRPI